MEIIGNKVLLRAIELEDCDLLLRLINDPETEMMLGGFSFPVSSSEQEMWIRNQSKNNNILRCIVTDRNNPQKGLGTVILSDIDYRNGLCQIHIKMAKDIGRGKGYGTDAVKTLSQYAFNELRLNCIYAEVLDYNRISQRLFEKCGYKREGLLRSRVFKSGKYVDVYSYSLLKAEYDA